MGHARKIIGIFLVLFVLLGSVCFASDEERYIILRFDGGEVYLFDTQTIKFDTNFDGELNFNVITVWLKTKYLPSGVVAKVEDRKKRDLPIEEWENLDHQLIQAKFNRRNKTFKSVQYIYYDKYGNILDQDKNPSPEWNDIIPGTNSEQWYNEINQYVWNNWSKVKDQSK